MRGEAVHRELLRRLKRAEEVAASIPDEELPSEEQREANKESHAPLYDVVLDLVKSELCKPLLNNLYIINYHMAFAFAVLTFIFI